MSQPTPRKVIYDTDPGVDDAMALYYALAHPGIEIVGITTTFGNVTVQQAATTPAGPQAAALAAAAAAVYSTGSSSGYIPKPLAEVEKETLTATLAYTKGNQDFAAHLLGISVTILREKLTTLGLL
mgnify:CR=1 FL=1